MSLSNSRLAYTDCFDLLDRALDEPRGIRIELADHNSANYLRMRIHHARTIDRNENTKTYPADHHLHGRSPYDILVCRIEGSAPAWLWLDKQKVEIGRIEAIEPGEQIEQAPEPLRLNGPQAEIVVHNPVVIEPVQQIPYIRRR